MNNFSISQLQQYSGIKAHTIRIWEQRYNALNPTRSDGNTRYYDNDQLRRLLNIVSLIHSDYKVSEVCSMPDDKLFSLVKDRLGSKSEESSSEEYFVSQLIAAGMCYNAFTFEKIFSVCISKLGLTVTYVKVIYPLLYRIGLMWRSNILPTAQEHFISNLIRQKLFSEIDKLPQAKTSKDTWLLFLPENEFHEIGLLFSYFMIRKAGKNVVYLGSSVSLKTVTESIKEIHPSRLLLFFVHNDEAHVCENYCNTLAKSFKNLKIYLSGSENLISKIKKGKSITWMRSVTELESELKITV